MDGSLGRRNLVEKQVLQVSFLSHDHGLGEAIARALGEGFLLRADSAQAVDKLQEILAWSDVVFLDLRRSNLQTEEAGLRLLEDICAEPAHRPVLALCDTEDREFLLRATQKGAIDSVPNPPNVVELRLLFRRAYQVFSTERELKSIKTQENHNGRLHELLGNSEAMLELFALVGRVGPCDVNVLITGETGTGKELVARAIHQIGPRSSSPLVAFSCANLPEALVEDELFGHEKGAFTGAIHLRQGRIESANHGTLFLDEIGDLALGLQPKLLRVLQEKTFERIGSNKKIYADVRLISATNRDLNDSVAQGKFREDLYYRLNVVELHLPPLRERRDDIPVLVYHFLTKAAERFHRKELCVTRSAMRALEQHHWPGNVRELENVIQRAMVLAEGRTLDVSHLPALLRNQAEDNVLQGPAQRSSPVVAQDGPPRECTSGLTASSYEEEMKHFKRNLVLRTLRQNGWSKAESARALGVARGYLHRLINQLNIREEEERTATEGSMKRSPAGPVM
ncbi:MAG TPA: sigma-54 dependent transcriptional regulator [Candidatus Acidoferrum sp.]|nr:sigma-54 dependent transcriptional regulator [Candidatus Acidoferrum sp.]